MNLHNMREQLENKNVKISTEEIQAFFKKIGLKNCYLIEKDTNKLCRSIFQITKEKTIIAEWDIFEIEPVFYIGNKTYSFVNFFDFLFFNLTSKDQGEIRNLYISFSSNQFFFENQVITFLNNKRKGFMKEIISRHIEVKKIKVSSKYFLKAEISVETEDGNKEYEVTSNGRELHSLVLNQKNKLNSIKFVIVLDDIENTLKSINYIFPKKISNDYYAKCLILLLILDKYETSREYRMKLLYEPDFVNDWKKIFEL